MVVLRVFKGLSASGKTTKALELVSQNDNWKRVNRDSLRLMIHGNAKWTAAREDIVQKARDALITTYLNEGFNTVLDDTNLSDKVLNHLKSIADKAGAAFEVDDSFLSVSVEDCIARDLKREVSVGKDVIIKQWSQSIGKPKIVKYDLNLPNAIICDIDGCLAQMKGRSPYEWDKVDTDEIQAHILRIVNLYAAQGITVFVLSGRDGCCYDKTYKWLKDNKVSFDYLFLRQAGDQRKDSIIKEEIYRNHIEGRYNVQLVIDDRPTVCRLWWSLGLPILSNHPLGIEF